MLMVCPSAQQLLKKASRRWVTIPAVKKIWFCIRPDILSMNAFPHSGDSSADVVLFFPEICQNEGLAELKRQSPKCGPRRLRGEMFLSRPVEHEGICIRIRFILHEFFDAFGRDPKNHTPRSCLVILSILGIHAHWCMIQVDHIGKTSLLQYSQLAVFQSSPPSTGLSTGIALPNR